MFCKYCGKELESGDRFCASCGTRIDAADEGSASEGYDIPQEGRQEQARQWSQAGARASTEGNVWEKLPLKNLNPVCIAGLIILVLDVFLFHNELFALASLIVSAVGLFIAKKKRQAGATIAIICIIVSAAILLNEAMWD